MYDIIKSVILSRRYELSAMCRKIDTVWLQNQLNDEQHTELLGMAREQADPQMSVDLYAKVMDLEARVAALEPAGPQEDFPEYVTGNTYRTGDGVMFRGKRYRCIAPADVACVWSPADYPAYWVEQMNRC